MATKRPTLLSCSMAIIATGIAGGFLVFSLLSIFTPAGDQTDKVDERSINFFLRCMRLLQVIKLPLGFTESHRDEWEAVACHDSFRLMQFSYESNGRLPPGYVEALAIWYKKNQTKVDFDICSLDFSRCSDQTMELRSRYCDEHPCHWIYESFSEI